MGKIRTALTAMLLLAATGARGQIVGAEIDLKTAMLVMSQTVAKVAEETANNKLVDSIKTSQTRIAAKTAAIVLVKESQRASMCNTDDFGPESRLYKRIGQKGVSVIEKVPRTLDLLIKTDLVSKATALHELGDISVKVTTLVNTFVDLCTNARFASPTETFKGEKPTMQGVLDGSGFTISTGGESTTITGVDAQGGKRGDGHNLLSRDQRYNMAYDIYSQLCGLEREINKMMYLAENARFGDMLRVYDRSSWNALNSGQSTVNSTIQTWKKLK